MSFGTFAAAGVTSNVLKAVVTLPRWGIFGGLLTLDRGDTILTGPGVLTLGTLTLVCTIRHGSTFAGRGMYEVFGGADGWSTTIPGTSYRSPQTPLSVLAMDAAASVGETVVMDTGGEMVIGSYVRMTGPASSVLNHYRPGQWWVEIDGTTHVGTRTPLPAPSVRVLDYKADLSLVEMSDDSAIVLPGQLFSSGGVVGTVSTVRHRLEGSRLRTGVYLQ
jgi:hypothetical protein